MIEQLDRSMDVVSAEHDIDMTGPIADRVTILLGKTTPDSDLQTRLQLFEPLEMTQCAVQLVVSVFPDAARVEDDHIGIGLGVDTDETIGFEQPGDSLRIVLVHLTPEGLDQIGPRLAHTSDASDMRAHAILLVLAWRQSSSAIGMSSASENSSPSSPSPSATSTSSSSGMTAFQTRSEISTMTSGFSVRYFFAFSRP